MKALVACVLAAMLPGVVGKPAAAAATSLALSTWLEEARSSPVRAQLGLEPILCLDGPQGRLTLEGRWAAWGPIRHEAQSVRAHGALALRPQAALQPELLMAVVHRRLGDRRTTGLRPAVRIHRAKGAAGVWISAAAEAGVDELESPGAAFRLPLLGLGAWARRSRVLLTAAVEQNLGILPRTPARDAGPDSSRVPSDLAPHPAAPEPEQVLLTTAFATVRWEGDRAELESVGGVTAGLLVAPRRWAQASLGYRLTSRMALVASVGSRSPQYYAIDPAGEPRAAVALRLSQGPTASPRAPLVARAEPRDFRLEPLAQGSYRISVSAPGARLVELNGDVTGWRPLALRRSGGARWETVLEIAAGIHHVNVRVDGGPWTPPPGLPSQADGFSALVGVLVVE